MYHFLKTALIFVLLLSISDKIFSQNDTIPIADSALLKQIEQQLSGTNTASPPTQTRTSPSTLPDISVIGDFEASYKNNVKRNFDATIHEVELSLQSVVDPYARADFFFLAKMLIRANSVLIWRKGILPLSLFLPIYN